MARPENFDPGPADDGPRYDPPDDFSTEDGLYEKYRVFREPQRDSQGTPVGEHPVPLDGGPIFLSQFTNRGGETVDIVTELPEITDEFLFVLKPSTDPHARVALAAYAWSVRKDKPLLHADLWDVLRQWVWDEGEEGDGVEGHV